MKNKKAMTSQTFFYIFMALIFMWILYFGYSKLSAVSDTLSEQERIEIKNDVKEIVEFCLDPLNRGSVASMKISHNSINSVCFLSDDANSIFELEDIAFLFDNGDDVILMESSFDENFEITSVDMVVDSFNFEGDFKTTQCWVSDSGSIDIEYSCN